MKNAIAHLRAIPKQAFQKCFQQRKDVSSIGRTTGLQVKFLALADTNDLGVQEFNF